MIARVDRLFEAHLIVADLDASIDKPVALINTSTRATIAHVSLRETLTTMSGRVVEDASITIPLEGSRNISIACGYF